MTTPPKNTFAKQLKSLGATTKAVVEAIGTAPHGEQLPSRRHLNGADIDDDFVRRVMGHVRIECTLFYGRQTFRKRKQLLKTEMQRLRERRDHLSGIRTLSLSTQESNACEKHHGNCDKEDLC